MTSRLVLVGMVATLGISVPGWLEVQHAVHAIHTWTALQLAAWDCSASNAEDGMVTVSMLRETATAPTRDGGTGPGGPRLAFEPIPVEDRVSDVALELNLRADGLKSEPEDSGAGRRARASGSPGSVAGRAGTEFGPEPLADALELKLAHDMLRIAERSKADSGPGADERMETPLLPDVALASKTAAPAAPVRPTAELATPDNGAVAPGTPPGPIDNGGSRLAERPERFAGASVTLPGDVFADPVQGDYAADDGGKGSETLPSDVFADPPGYPSFEPIEAGPEIASGTADELNRASEGLAYVVAASRRVERSDPAPVDTRSELGQAIRLTHDAIHAWMNVLTGPAVVQVSVR